MFGGDSFSAPPLFSFLFFSFSPFSFFCCEAVGQFHFQSRRGLFFFGSFSFSLDRKRRRWEILGLGRGRQDFSDIVSVGIPVERVKP